MIPLSAMNFSPEFPYFFFSSFLPFFLCSRPRTERNKRDSSRINNAARPASIGSRTRRRSLASENRGAEAANIVRVETVFPMDSTPQISPWFSLAGKREKKTRAASGRRTRRKSVKDRRSPRVSRNTKKIDDPGDPSTRRRRMERTIARDCRVPDGSTIAEGATEALRCSIAISHNQQPKYLEKFLSVTSARDESHLQYIDNEPRL